MTVTLLNCAEGGTNGTGATAGSGGNTGGNSGNFWDSVNIPAGSTLTFDNTHAAHGSLAYKFATGATATLDWLQWDASLGSGQTTVWIRRYMYLTANPSAGLGIARWLTASGGSQCARLVINATGHITFNDGANAVQLTSTNTVPLNAWFRIEAFCTGSATTGQLEFKLFTSMDSSTPTETQTSGTALNTTGTIGAVGMGITGNTLASETYWGDDFGASTAGYIGPVTSPVVTTGSLPGGTVGTAYSGATETESSGTAPFSWAVTTGALPTGLSMSSGGVISGTPTGSPGTSSFTVTVTDVNGLTGTANQSIVISAGSPTPTVVNTWTFGVTNQYGLQQVPIGNSSGNALFAVCGLGSNSQSILPRFNIADDAHNWWNFAGTRFDKTATRNRRVDVWDAPNASPASTASVAESWFTNGVVGAIFEVSNFPLYAQVDFVAGVGGFGTSAAVSATAAQSDFVMGALLISDAGSAPTVTYPAGLTSVPVQQTFSASTDQTSQCLYAAWGKVAAGAVSETWSWTGSHHFEAVLVGFSLTPTAPSQPNPAWPSMKVEAGFGFQPGDVSAMPTWTDITTRAIDEDGAVVLKTGRGRDFELAQPDAGETTLTLDNHDGAFNPNNTSSPYYPNVLPEAPLRASAIWNGKQYAVGFAWAKSWPQQFRDPQYGETPFEGTDTVGTASDIELPSALAGDYLIDQPYSYHPLGESYSPANGGLFANLSRTNLRPAWGVDDNKRAGGLALTTGQTTNIPGDSATGVGASGSTYTTKGGPGVLYRDPNLPQLAAGFTVEFWATAVDHTANDWVAILTVEGPPGNWPTTGPDGDGAGDGTRLGVQLANSVAGNQQIIAQLSDWNGRNSIDGSGGAPITANTTGWHQIVVTAIDNSGTWTITVYVDGVQGFQFTTAAVPSTITNDRICMGPVVTNGGIRGLIDYTITQVVTYGYLLDPTRIAQHFNTGSTACKSESTVNRFARLLAWSGQGLPAAATLPSPSPSMGNADQIQGQALADAGYDLSRTDGGMFFCDGAGNLWYVSRAWFYNRPSKFTFGDFVNPGFMSDNTNISSCYAIDPVTTAAIFNKPNSFISGGSPTTDPRPAGFSQAIPLLNYDTYAQFKADVTNANYTQNGVLYTPNGPINSVFKWVRYDIEGGATWPTPSEEKADPQTYLANFISLAHANGYKVMVTPARDLGNTDTVHPLLTGESLEQWYIRTNIPAASANADILSVQSQADQGNPALFSWYYNTARNLAKAANPNIGVWCGLSVTYGNGPNMFASAQLGALAEGFWINIISDTTDSLALMKLLLGQSLQAPYLTGDFDFSDTFLYNQTGSQRTISAGSQNISGGNSQVARIQFNQFGVDALEADPTSETQYRPRKILQQDIETNSDQDAYDRANWSLVKYKQPHLRANQILLDPSSNPLIWPVALGVEQGDVVTVSRQPLGSPPIAVQCIVQKVEHEIGPSHWHTTLTLAPYYPEGNVIQLGANGFDTPSSGVLAW